MINLTLSSTPRRRGSAIGLIASVCAAVLSLAAVAYAQGGDDRTIEFVRPFSKARQQAADTNRLLFLKPVYGGVDQLGARDYRYGQW